MLNIGAKAPGFTTLDDSGSEVSLSDWLGSWVLLWWYPSANTPGCTAQGLGLTKQADEFRQKKCQVVGISFDSVEDNASFRQRYGFPFPLLSDPEQAIGIAYGAVRPSTESAYSPFARRISYLVDPEGLVVQTYEVTDPGGHAAAVLADLEAAQR